MKPIKSEGDVFNPTIRGKIKHLEMMGYTVGLDVSNGFITIGFTTKNDYKVQTKVSQHEMHEDFILERIVSRINDYIINHF